MTDILNTFDYRQDLEVHCFLP